MTSPDLIALLVVAAVLVCSATPFVLLAWFDLRQLQQGREERERLLLASVQFLPPLRVPSAAGAAPALARAPALASALASAPALASALALALSLAPALAPAPSPEKPAFSVESFSSIPLLSSRPCSGGPSVCGACGQLVGGDCAPVSAAPTFAVNELSIRTVHTVPQARSTAARLRARPLFIGRLS